MADAAARRSPARSGAAWSSIPYLRSAPRGSAAMARARPRRGSTRRSALRGAIDLEVVACARSSASRAWRPATLLGSGAVENLGRDDRGRRRSRVVVDRRDRLARCSSAISSAPGNARSSTAPASSSRSSAPAPAPHEGRLQVELAALTYQRSRLVRSWTHLERQRGGFGFLGGPGESQLEIDRRLITDRIAHAEARARSREAHPRAASRARASACPIRWWRWSATPMPANRPCSTA